MLAFVHMDDIVGLLVECTVVARQKTCRSPDSTLLKPQRRRWSLDLPVVGVK